MRLVEEIPAPSPAAAEAVAALRAAREASASEDQDQWAPSGASAAWDEPRGLTNTEAAQMEELRSKYGKYQRERDGGDAVHTDDGIRAAQERMDAEFCARPYATPEEIAAAASRSSQIRVCDKCRGMRTLKEEYNHRIMERSCDKCDGEGVLDGGRPLTSADQGVHQGGAPDSASTPQTESPFSPGSAAEVRVATLSRDARRLQRQIDARLAEAAKLQTRLDAGEEMEAEEEQALAELIHQLQRHVRSLREKAEEKQSELENLTASLRGDVELDADELP